MASPFSVFRKRQKLMMALLCLMAIIAFVFLSNMGNPVGGRSSDGIWLSSRPGSTET
jgi:hypothetical protein